MSIAQVCALLMIRAICIDALDDAPHCAYLVCMDAKKLIAELECAGRSATPRQDPKDLCHQAGINRATWQRIKSGRTEPQHATLKSLLRLANSLSVKVDIYPPQDSQEAA